MAQSNKRYFNTFFFEDPYIEDLDANTTLLYLTIILNPHNNLAGCYEISIRKLMNYTKLEETEVKLAIQKLSEDKKILFSDNWIAIKNFIKNNEFNPNMCKKAFDIMTLAPKDKIVFILSDTEGNIEPWVSDFVLKVESGINSTIDSQNRNAISHAKKKGLPAPIKKPHINFGVNDLSYNLFSKENKPLMGTIPPTIPIKQGDTSGEIEFEFEKEIEIEKEIETIDSDDTPITIKSGDLMKGVIDALTENSKVES